jgi:hypothetical protein
MDLTEATLEIGQAVAAVEAVVQLELLQAHSKVAQI